MDYTRIIKELTIFVVITIIFLIILKVILLVRLKQFKLDKKKLKMYGLLLNLNEKAIMAITCVFLNYIFLIYLLVTFRDINIIYIIFTFSLVIVSGILNSKKVKIILDVLLNAINCIAIKIIYLLYNYYNNEYMSTIVLIGLVLVIIFSFLYFTYNMFRSLNNIVAGQKYLNKKNYQI